MRNPKRGRLDMFGAFVALVTLFVWRTCTARTRGANLWLVGVGFWVPTIAVGLAAGYGIGALLHRSFRRDTP